MFIRMRDSHPRSMVKALSWRVVGSLDTFVLSLIFTRSLRLAAGLKAFLQLNVPNAGTSLAPWCFIGPVASTSHRNR
jgi:hypothetical protein